MFLLLSFIYFEFFSVQNAFPQVIYPYVITIFATILLSVHSIQENEPVWSNQDYFFLD